SGAYSILTDNSANWNTAYGWGNHAGLYSLTSHTHSSYQATLSGTGLVKSTAGVISYDTNTYVTGTPWTSMGYLTNLATGTPAQLALTNPGVPMFSIVTGAVGSASTALATGSQIYSFVTGLGYLTSITKAQVEAVLTGSISTHSHTAAAHNIQSHSDVYIPVTLDASYSGRSLYWTGSNWGIGTPWTSAGYLTGITKAQVEAVLTGTISTHTHSYESTLGNPGTSGYVLSSTTSGVRSWVAMGGAYTLPLAGSAVRGGIQINGTTPAAGCLPVSLYNESPYISMTKAVVEYVLTGLITTHTHSYAPINGSSSNAFATANLSVTGTITATSTITGSEVYRGSSRTLKNNIADFDFDALGFLSDVDIMRYNLKSNGSFGIGFIAEQTHPWLSGIDQKSHNFGNHLGLLTKAIQQEDQKVEELKFEILDLKARIKELEIARSHGWR
ncbi:MAG: tail fiber domain-containing protein, partial [Mariniphaga sp.]